MNRREILQRRHYAAVPKATLARVDLTASTKIVYTTLIGELFSDQADSTELSTADIAAKSGLGQRTVRGALRDLETAGLIASHHTPGLPSIYKFPTTDTETQPRQNLPTPPAKSAGVPDDQPRQNPPTTPAESAEPPAKSAYPYKELNDSERFLEPPKPPATGERDDGPPPNQSNDTIATIAQAYQQATGRKLPNNWATAAQKQLDSGHHAILEEIDAPAITAARAYAQKRGLAFAFGTLLLSIRQSPRRDTAGLDRAARAIAQAETARQTEADAAAKRAADNLTAFRQLPEGERQEWTDTIARGPGPKITRPDIIEILAAGAYDQRDPPLAEKRKATG